MFNFIGRMMSLPTDFLPFDPSRDNKDSDDEEEEELPESDEETNDDNLHETMSNGETKQSRHIGGGVLLVNRFHFRENKQ